MDGPPSLALSYYVRAFVGPTYLTLLYLAYRANKSSPTLVPLHPSPRRLMLQATVPVQAFLGATLLRTAQRLHVHKWTHPTMDRPVLNPWHFAHLRSRSSLAPPLSSLSLSRSLFQVSSPPPSTRDHPPSPTRPPQIHEFHTGIPPRLSPTLAPATNQSPVICERQKPVPVCILSIGYDLGCSCVLPGLS